ncbi:MAG: MBL fold metallo-hydrolase [Bdellovibrionaceae bacterium]|nr:MBL fold metallo-hydrolase [Pseudobdellovibrionaceae bacterium]
MNISVVSYPAKNGDCFLVSFGQGESQKHLLIDCGFADTVTNYLKNDLKNLSSKNEVLEKLILTHIDADHIQGAIKLLKDNNSEKFIEIKEVWHNTFRHLFEKNETNYEGKNEQILHQIIQRGYPSKKSDEKREYPISAEQGTTVGALILQGEYSWNSDFDNNGVNCDYKKEVIIDTDTSIFLLSPDKQKLEALKSLWKDELRKYGVNYEYGKSQLYDDAFEMLMAWEKEIPKRRPKEISATEETVEELLTLPFDEDKTATNGSSIAFILNIQDRKLLFLADAHPDLIVKSLNKYVAEGTILFDMIKVSHHGSFRNINSKLLERIDASKYLISTSGGIHNHPDKETIAQIVSRRADFHRQLYFNYITSNSRYFEQVDWMRKYNYSIHYLNNAPFRLQL